MLNTKLLKEINESLKHLRVSNDLIVHQLNCLSEDNITIIDNLINIRWEIKAIRERIK